MNVRNEESGGGLYEEYNDDESNSFTQQKSIEHLLWQKPKPLRGYFLVEEISNIEITYIHTYTNYLMVMSIMPVSRLEKWGV